LNGEDPCSELKRSYPVAAKMVVDGTWRDALLRRGLWGDEGMEDEDEVEFDSDEDDGGDEDGEDGIEEGAESEDEDEDEDEESRRMRIKKVQITKGKSVLVISAGGQAFWDAKVLDVAMEGGEAAGYRVHYKKWSSRGGGRGAKR